MSVKQLSAEVEANLRDLRAMTDDQIDLSDIPEITDFSGFHRKGDAWSRRCSFVMEVEPEMVEWFRDHANAGEDWHQGAKQVLQDFVNQAKRRAA